MVVAMIPIDTYGHGTETAGIASATPNNNMGVSGVAWGATIMPVKVMNSKYGTTTSNIIKGLLYAV